ncbi:MAG: LysR family transcriptional regulator [Aestuariivirga sp.]|uniref:LysR family transcriptional regulator n=2 Tax=Aestuariivirga sp. TaxID=2650926 RepID=UPI00301AF3F7
MSAIGRTNSKTSVSSGGSKNNAKPSRAVVLELSTNFPCHFPLLGRFLQFLDQDSDRRAYGKLIMMSLLIRDDYKMMGAFNGDLDIDLLRAFLFVQQTGGFSQAAALLNRTQPAISLQIKRLEARVGNPVFERSRSGTVSLTATGITLSSYAHQILAMHDEAVSRLAAPSIRSRVRIGILEELGHSRLPIVLRSFLKVFPSTSPQVQVSLSNQLVNDLMLGRLDMAVVAGQPDFMQGVSLWLEPLVWVGSSAVPVPLKPPLPLVLLPDPCFYRRAAAEALAGIGMHWTQACLSSTMAGVRATVIAGLGITIMGQSEVTEGLRIIGSELSLPQLPPAAIMIYYRSKDLDEAAQSLSKHVRRSLN